MKPNGTLVVLGHLVASLEIDAQAGSRRLSQRCSKSARRGRMAGISIDMIRETLIIAPFGGVSCPNTNWGARQILFNSQ